MSAHDPRTRERLEKDRAFWERSARGSTERAVLDADAEIEPGEEDRHFERAGLRDALAMAHFVPAGARVVDLGSGSGRVMRPLAPLCSEIVGVDISPTMVERGREALADLGNARFVQTDGATLPTIEDASVGFLYSLLCLIHVDKRAAYRYLREIERVLEPGAMALLQFENLLSDEGLAEFQRVVDLPHEYPLEFYTPPEIERLVNSVGLEVLTLAPSANFLLATVRKGSVEGTIESCTRDVRVELLAADGFFASPRPALDEAGTFRARLQNDLAERQVFLATLDVTPLGAPEPVIFGGGRVPMDPCGVTELRVEKGAGDGGLSFFADGRALEFQLQAGALELPGGPADLVLALAPAGFAPGAETDRLFPLLTSSRRIELA